MKIELRSRKHKSGNTTLYLEFYEKEESVSMNR